MELHSILEQGEIPSKLRMWYVISAGGCAPPSMRVGHSALTIPSDQSTERKILVLGGADPGCVFTESHLLNLDTYEWEKTDWKGFKGRYEHAAFIPTTNNGRVYVFGGADQSGNLNSVQMIDLRSGEWTEVVVSGQPPCARTCRGSAWCGDQLYIFSGGEQGANPVADPKLHVFDADSCSWRQPPTTGVIPKPRHGHAMVAINNKLYLFGGMARETFHSDLHEFDIASSSWRQVDCSGVAPPGVAAHGAVACRQRMIIFGGMTPEGASDSTYVLDTESFIWKRVELSGPPPASRLDHAMCIVKMPQRSLLASIRQSSASANRDVETGIIDITGDARYVVDGVQQSEPAADEGVPEDTRSGSYRSGAETGATESSIPNAGGENCPEITDVGIVAEEVACVFIHGGMDTGGQIFEDCLIMRLDEL